MPPGNVDRPARKIIIPAIMIFMSVLVSLPLGEVAVRLALDEIDYLTPKMIPHEHLIHAIEPGSGVHDAWGFRNHGVPESAEIIAIGDSQTYGVSATSRDSWPAQLKQITGTEVYNLGIGGYGPIDYLYLFNKYVKELGSRVAIIAFYFGNDLPDAYSAVTENSLGKEDQNLRSTRSLRMLRDWLSKNILLYQVIKSQLPRITTVNRRQEIIDSVDEQYVLLPHLGDTSLLQTEIRRSALDLTIESNRIGLKVTLDVISQISGSCATRRIECYFLLIPTKGSVYQDIARTGLKGDELQKIEHLVKSEEQVRSALNNHLKS